MGLEFFDEISRWAWILKRELGIVSKRSNRVVVHLDWFGPLHLMTVAIALTSFKLTNFVRFSFRRPTEMMLWIQMHSRREYKISERVPMLLLRVFRIATTISVYSPGLARFYSARVRGHVIEVSGPPINETINKMVSEENIGYARSLGRDDTEKLVCLLAGQVTPGKRYEIMERLLSTATRDLANTGIKIKLRVPRGLQVHNMSDRVDVLETDSGLLTEQEYVSGYLTSEVVLMPYVASRYGDEASGVFIDAVTLGCMPLVSKHTTMASELEKFGLGELAVDWDSDFSWKFIVSVAQDAGVREKFNKMSLMYRKRHSLPSFAAEVSRIIFQP
jgi:hypothetical protein